MFAVFSAAELFKVASISSRTLPYGHRHAKLSFHLYKEGYARPAPVRIGDPREGPGLQTQMSDSQIQKDVPEQIDGAMGKGSVPCPATALHLGFSISLLDSVASTTLYLVHGPPLQIADLRI